MLQGSSAPKGWDPVGPSGEQSQEDAIPKHLLFQSHDPKGGRQSLSLLLALLFPQASSSGSAMEWDEYLHWYHFASSHSPRFPFTMNQFTDFTHQTSVSLFPATAREVNEGKRSRPRLPACSGNVYSSLCQPGLRFSLRVVTGVQVNPPVPCFCLDYYSLQKDLASHQVKSARTMQPILPQTLV